MKISTSIGIGAASLMCIVVPAYADTPSSIQIALAPLQSWAISFLMAFIAGLATLAFAYAKSHWKFMQSVSMQERVLDAASRGAGIANDFLQSQAALHPTIDLKPTAIALGVKHVIDSYPDYQKQLGLDPDKIANIIVGELGQLLTPAPVLIAPAPIVVANDPTPLVKPVVAQPDPTKVGAALEGTAHFVLDQTKL